MDCDCKFSYWIQWSWLKIWIIEAVDSTMDTGLPRQVGVNVAIGVGAANQIVAAGGDLLIRLSL